MASDLVKWLRGDLNCVRCRSKMGLLSGKHTCRACRRVLCDRCCALHNVPSCGGIVRMCVACFERYSSGTSSVPIGWAIPTPTDDQGKPQAITQRKDERPNREENKEFSKEDEELALALALSQSESEAKMACTDDSNLYPITDDEVREGIRLQKLMCKEEGFQMAHVISLKEEQNRLAERKAPTLTSYLDRGFWEKKHSENQSKGLQNSIIGASSYSEISGSNASKISSSNKEELAKTIEVCQSAKEQAAALDNRMNSTLIRRGSIANDSGIRSLAGRVSNCHGHVLSALTKLEADQEYYAGLQQKLTHIRKSKEMLIGLRSEYAQQKEESVVKAREPGRLQMQHQSEHICQGIYARDPVLVSSVGESQPMRQAPDAAKKALDVATKEISFA